MYRCDVVSVSRGLYRHEGILFLDGTVLHASKDEGKVVLETLGRFANGREVSIRSVSTKFSPNEVYQRGLARRGDGYRLIDSNCEHLVSDVLGLKDGSPQLRFAIACLVIVGGIFLLRRPLA